MQDITREVTMNSSAMFSKGLLHMDVPALINQYIHHFYANAGCSLEELQGVMNNRDETQERGMQRQRETELGNSLLSAQVDDDDDDDDDDEKLFIINNFSI